MRRIVYLSMFALFLSMTNACAQVSVERSYNGEYRPQDNGEINSALVLNKLNKNRDDDSNISEDTKVMVVNNAKMITEDIRSESNKHKTESETTK